MSQRFFSLSTRFLVLFLTTLLWPSRLHGGLEVLEAAKHRGSFGLRVTTGIDETSVATAVGSSFSRLRVRFYLRLDGLDLAEATSATVFTAENDGPANIAIQVTRIDGQLRLGWQVRLDNGSFAEVLPPSGPALTAAWHAIELRWQAGSGDGSFHLLFDGQSQMDLDALDNDATLIQSCRLGLIDGDQGTYSGHADFDDFTWRTEGTIGLLSLDPAELTEPASQWPERHSILYLIGLVSEIRTSP